MSKDRGKLIVAVDVDTFEEAKGLVDVLSEDIGLFKIGSQLFTACGPTIVDYIYSKGKKIFLDLKYHDIPNTVGNAVRAAVNMGKKPGGIFMCTVHTVGGKAMLKKAADEARKASGLLGIERPLIVGITVLTSEEVGDSISALVLERARLAKESSLDGIVASSQEAALVRKEMGEDFVIVTPGIRPHGASAGDQKRITTPFDAIKNGSDFLVVGRPIVKADDPALAAKRILEEIEQAKNSI
ncbi:MAG: orotidine 5'-phosphate decarboxylase [Omnitrophica WOR_2 bacterium RIFOXYB2_FULL_38_16]|nr:MAG: orotidine 5'-phosphate decarboxylase [Omnitrophica WOR_2 bacterium RIFOXYA2_FULL_38_17]OGX54530.1 MAG: orotidine 5'-phosphate decarboxylase [Omnitrophica WOR_2 bacterium RIFOXYA12_FULL_38_10]OGX54956.1 MAG: orotidine 5'-phosphate decarboxylase [Omnitrophica WOR_2 bacterium RIFOXYC2_FULL_38_12]OGX59468.1 MAG: orotidine 5'-phosphate decarboxylase [Omnitrophica WOR_2 bacterium RIFOXYB2_FULL_38_16]HBG62067.1 orotidine-5'-phosphate decarboxylase [Candidatus Omnitrophota bacterium]